MRFSRMAVVGIVAAGALLGAGVAYASTMHVNTAVKATATDTIVTTKKNTNLGASGGVATTLISVTLPHGKFVLQASGDAVNFGPSDYVRCQIYVGTKQVASVSTIVGTQSGETQGAAGLVSPFALTGGYNNTAGSAKAMLKCDHDHSNTSQPYVDGGATLWVHRTTSLKTVSG